MYQTNVFSNSNNLFSQEVSYGIEAEACSPYYEDGPSEAQYQFNYFNNGPVHSQVPLSSQCKEPCYSYSQDSYYESGYSIDPSSSSNQPMEVSQDQSFSIYSNSEEMGMIQSYEVDSCAVEGQVDPSYQCQTQYCDQTQYSAPLEFQAQYSCQYSSQNEYQAQSYNASAVNSYQNNYFASDSVNYSQWEAPCTGYYANQQCTDSSFVNNVNSSYDYSNNYYSTSNEVPSSYSQQYNSNFLNASDTSFGSCSTANSSYPAPSNQAFSCATQESALEGDLFIEDNAAFVDQSVSNDLQSPFTDSQPQMPSENCLNYNSFPDIYSAKARRAYRAQVLKYKREHNLIVYGKKVIRYPKRSSAAFLRKRVNGKFVDE